MEPLKEAKPFIDEAKIQSRIKELAEQINQDYAGKEVTVVCILKGGVVFFVDMIRHLNMPLKCEFLTLSSYGNSTSSSGEVKLVSDTKEPLEGKHVLILEDIVDTGLTLSYLVNLLKARGLASLKICSLLFKPESLIRDVKPDYHGFEIGNQFVVGYGLDYQGYYRNLPYIGLLEA